MPPVLTLLDVLKHAAHAPERAEIAPLPLLLRFALRPQSYKVETALDILARDYPDLHLRAMAWLG